MNSNTSILKQRISAYNHSASLRRADRAFLKKMARRDKAAKQTRPPSYFGYMNRLTRAGAPRLGVLQKGSPSSSGFGYVGGNSGSVGRLGFGGTGQLGSLKNRAGSGGLTVGGYTPGGVWPQKREGPSQIFVQRQSAGGNVFDRGQPAPTQGVPNPPSPQEQEAKRIAREERTKKILSRAKGIASTIGSATSKIGNKAGAAAVSFGKLAQEKAQEGVGYIQKRTAPPQVEAQPSPFESIIKKVHAEPQSQREEEQELRRDTSTD